MRFDGCSTQDTILSRIVTTLFEHRKVSFFFFHPFKLPHITLSKDRLGTKPPSSCFHFQRSYKKPPYKSRLYIRLTLIHMTRKNRKSKAFFNVLSCFTTLSLLKLIHPITHDIFFYISSCASSGQLDPTTRVFGFLLARDPASPSTFNNNVNQFFSSSFLIHYLSSLLIFSF